jgi:hypothetical protein
MKKGHKAQSNHARAKFIKARLDLKVTLKLFLSLFLQLELTAMSLFLPGLFGPQARSKKINKE